MILPIKSILKVGIPVVLTAAAYAVMKKKEEALSPEKPHSDAPIIAAMGDSITYGSGVKDTRKTDTWEYKLEQRFAGAYQVLNFGVSGATLQDEGDTPYWSLPDGHPQAALALNPEIVILMLGTNDSKPYNWNRERYEAQLDKRVKEIKATASVKRLILLCPPYCCPVDGAGEVAYDIRNETIRDDIRPIVKQCAADNQVECVDLYALTEGHPEMFADGVHPNSLGNFFIAKHLHEYLTKSE